MAAESDDPTTRSVPEWLIPPPGGFTADDFLQMRGLPRHTELIDGSLVFVSPQRLWHVQMIDLLKYELMGQAPKGLRVTREMSVKLNDRQVPEPDVMVANAEAFARKGLTTHFLADAVLLAVEVVSPDSEARDRDTKPRKYAAAGIPHFWRVEQGEPHDTVYVYERDPATGAYVLGGIHHERLKTVVPYEIDIDLTSVDQY